MKVADCLHYDPSAEAAPRAARCEACQAGQALRACTTCGRVSCCESQLAHNRAHWRESTHPVIREVSPKGGGFLWCYACGDYLE